MTNPPTVHVFVSADCQRVALWLLPHGGNVPSLDSGWRALAIVPMTVEGLRKYLTDASAAIANLTVTGFHVAPIGAQVISFPQAHRRPA